MVTHLDDRELAIKAAPGIVIKDGTIKVIHGEGMPTYKNPFEKGRLFISFKVCLRLSWSFVLIFFNQVVFPPNNFATPEQLAALEKLLPARPSHPAPGPDAEENLLQEHDPDTSDFGKVQMPSSLCQPHVI